MVDSLRSLLEVDADFGLLVGDHDAILVVLTAGVEPILHRHDFIRCIVGLAGDDSYGARRHAGALRKKALDLVVQRQDVAKHDLLNDGRLAAALVNAARRGLFVLEVLQHGGQLRRNGNIQIETEFFGDGLECALGVWVDGVNRNPVAVDGLGANLDLQELAFVAGGILACLAADNGAFIGHGRRARTVFTESLGVELLNGGLRLVGLGGNEAVEGGALVKLRVGDQQRHLVDEVERVPDQCHFLAEVARDFIECALIATVR